MASTTKILRLGSLVTSTAASLAEVNIKGAAVNIKEAASLAAESLASGAVIAVPTDTIYGLACLVQVTLIVIVINIVTVIVNVIVIQHSAAVERLYSIKVSIIVLVNIKIKVNILSGKKCQEANRDLRCGD